MPVTLLVEEREGVPVPLRLGELEPVADRRRVALLEDVQEPDRRREAVRLQVWLSRRLADAVGVAVSVTEATPEFVYVAVPVPVGE